MAGSFAAEPAAAVRMVDDVPAWKGLPIEEHGGRVTWRAPLQPGAGEARGSVRLQLCQDTSCLPPRTIAFTAAAGPAPGLAADAPAGHQPERSPAERRRYAQAEDRARADGRGLWAAADPVAPWDHRKVRRAAASADLPDAPVLFDPVAVQSARHHQGSDWPR